jgi:predicted NBD/HSP70 family sugar kinase
MNGKFFGGLDIHKESITGCIMDGPGNIIREHSFPVKMKAVEKLKVVDFSIYQKF